MKKNRSHQRAAAADFDAADRLTKNPGPIILPLEELLAWTDDIAMWLDWCLTAAKKWKSKKLIDATRTCRATLDRFQDGLTSGVIIDAVKASYKLRPELDALEAEFNSAPKTWLRHRKDKFVLTKREAGLEDLVTQLCKLGEDRKIIVERAQAHFKKRGRSFD